MKGVKLLLKLSNANRELNLETVVCSFAMPNNIDVPSWLLLSSCLVTKSFSNGYFLIWNSFCWFPGFQGFRFLSYMLMFYNKHIFFNLASVFLNFLINWTSSVGCVLLNTYKHHHNEARFMFISICEPMSRCRSIYVVFMWFVFLFHFHYD